MKFRGERIIFGESEPSRDKRGRPKKKGGGERPHIFVNPDTGEVSRSDVPPEKWRREKSKGKSGEKEPEEYK